MRLRLLIALIALSAAAEAFGSGLVQAEGWTRELPVDPTGTVWLNNPYGSIDVIGTDDNKITVIVQRVVTAMDEQAMKDGRELCVTSFEGDSRVRLVRTMYPEPRDPRWSAVVNYTVRVPRALHVKIGGRAMDHIRVAQVVGTVTVSSFSGTIILSN